MGSSCWMHSVPVSMLKMMPLAHRLVQPVSCFKWIPLNASKYNGYKLSLKQKPIKLRGRHHVISATAGQIQPLDLSEENVNQVLGEAKSEFMQLFDPAVGITGVVELAELDGPFVKLRLKGRFWHKRSTVLARLGTYLQKRIPEILEVDIEDEAQLDDSPENF